MGTITKRRERVRVHPYLAPDVAKRLNEFSKASGLTESQVVQTALLRYLNRENDQDLLLRRFDRLGLALDAVHHDLCFLGEAVSVFVRLWLAHTPELTDEDKDPAHRKSERRFGLYLKHALDRFKNGPRFFDAMTNGDLVGVNEPAAPTGPPSADAPSDDYVATLLEEEELEEVDFDEE